jgi:hypothetical protein
MAGMGNGSAQLSEDERRVLKAIATGKCMPTAGDGADALVLRDASGKGLRAPVAALDALARRALIARHGGSLRLSPSGEAMLRRETANGDPFLAQHRDMDVAQVETAHGRAAVAVNHGESPLTQLMRRRNRDGAPFLNQREFDAGERLRADYTRGQIMPRLGANWESSISTGRRGAASTDLSDGALTARVRVERALDAVGPELSGVLVDICCFLKGFETVESERGWPVRSAKIVLKTALGSLARHYQPERPTPGRKRAILSWGASDYRPTVSG